MARRRYLLETEKTFRYTYAETISKVVTRLRVLSRSQGQHSVLRQELEVSPPPVRVVRIQDRFGNDVREFHHDRIDSSLEFKLNQATECCAYSLAAAPRSGPRLTAILRKSLMTPSALVDPCEELRSTAAAVPKDTTERERFESFGAWVHREMRFQAGVTEIGTPASEALRGRAGVCQDYTHILLSLCCAAGIPARYVSGFVPGEGYMHAWVEALVSPQPGESASWVGFDPTHNRLTDLSYLRVAIGRDYADISPISGSFCGSQPGTLTSWARHIVHPPQAPVATVPALGRLAVPVSMA